MPNVALRGISDTLHDALKAAAQRNHRSLNGEILARLEASFETRPADPAALLERVQARRDRLRLPELTPGLLHDLKNIGRS